MSDKPGDKKTTLPGTLPPLPGPGEGVTPHAVASPEAYAQMAKEVMAHARLKAQQQEVALVAWRRALARQEPKTDAARTCAIKYAGWGFVLGLFAYLLFLRGDRCSQKT